MHHIKCATLIDTTSAVDLLTIIVNVWYRITCLLFIIRQIPLVSQTLCWILHSQLIFFSMFINFHVIVFHLSTLLNACLMKIPFPKRFSRFKAQKVDGNLPKIFSFTRKLIGNTLMATTDAALHCIGLWLCWKISTWTDMKFNATDNDIIKAFNRTIDLAREFIKKSLKKIGYQFAGFTHRNLRCHLMRCKSFVCNHMYMSYKL